MFLIYWFWNEALCSVCFLQSTVSFHPVQLFHHSVSKLQFLLKLFFYTRKFLWGFPSFSLNKVFLDLVLHAVTLTFYFLSFPPFLSSFLSPSFFSSSPQLPFTPSLHTDHTVFLHLASVWGALPRHGVSKCLYHFPALWGPVCFTAWVSSLFWYGFCLSDMFYCLDLSDMFYCLGLFIFLKSKEIAEWGGNCGER